MRVLVVADGRHGATEEIAKAITETLQDKDIEVDLRHPESVVSVHGYDAVVAGSAVYIGRWVSSLRSFVHRLEGELLGVPVWLFSCGPLDDPPFKEGTSTEAAEGDGKTSGTGSRALRGTA